MYLYDMGLIVTLILLILNIIGFIYRKKQWSKMFLTFQLFFYIIIIMLMLIDITYFRSEIRVDKKINIGIDTTFVSDDNKNHILKTHK
jgi:uncharacterized membrane protein